MIQNIDIMKAATDLADYIKLHPAINEFIAEQFGTDTLNVYVGDMLRRQMPGAKETPYLVIYDFNKRVGIDTKFSQYSCNIAIGVGMGARPEFVTTDTYVKYLDAYDVSCRFANLIIDVIDSRRNGQRPLSSVEESSPVVVDADGGHWASVLTCVWRVYNTMGTELEEF